MTLPITTKRLVLRRFTHDDVPDLLECVSDPSFARATPEMDATEAGVRAYIDMQNAYQLFERDQRFELAIQRKMDGKWMDVLIYGILADEWSLGTGVSPET